MATDLGRIYPLFHSGFYCTRGSAAPRNLQRSHPLVAAEKRLESLAKLGFGRQRNVAGGRHIRSLISRLT
jgi:hypothetical protein